jgi:hypothetical protein
MHGCGDNLDYSSKKLFSIITTMKMNKLKVKLVLPSTLGIKIISHFIFVNVFPIQNIFSGILHYECVDVVYIFFHGKFYCPK